MKTPILIVFFFCFINCTKPVDFNQIDAAEIKANYIVTQVFFNLRAPDFLDESGNEMNVKTDIIEAPISGNTKKNIEKIEFTVVTENSFNRAFNVEIVLFDALQTPIYKLNPTINIPPNSGEITTIIEIPIEDIDIVFNTQYFAFFVSMNPSANGSILIPSDTAVLNFKSSVELFLNYTTE